MPLELKTEEGIVFFVLTLSAEARTVNFSRTLCENSELFLCLLAQAFFLIRVSYHLYAGGVRVSLVSKQGMDCAGAPAPHKTETERQAITIPVSSITSQTLVNLLVELLNVTQRNNIHC